MTPVGEAPSFVTVKATFITSPSFTGLGFTSNPSCTPEKAAAGTNQTNTANKNSNAFFFIIPNSYRNFLGSSRSIQVHSSETSLPTVQNRQKKPIPVLFRLFHVKIAF